MPGMTHSINASHNYYEEEEKRDLSAGFKFRGMQCSWSDLESALFPFPLSKTCLVYSTDSFKPRFLVLHRKGSQGLKILISFYSCWSS